MSYTHWYESGHYITKRIRLQKLTKYAYDNLKPQTDAIAALADEIWHEHFTPIIGSEQVDYMLAKYQSADQIRTDINKNGYTYFTAFPVKDPDNDKLIGYCGVAPGENYMLLSKLYVHRNFRGKGIARSFLNEAAALCRWEYEFDKIRLAVNKQNYSVIKIYQKMGFNVVDSVKTDIGGGFFMDDYVMELVLPPVVH